MLSPFNTPQKLDPIADVMRGLDPGIHHVLKEDGLPGQARQ